MGNTFKNMDFVTFGIFAFLTILGIVNVYSSAYIEELPSLFSLDAPYGKQVIWWLFSFALGGLIFLLRPDFFQTNAIFIYIFVILLLILVLLVGEEKNGAKAWFGVGSFGIQPAEFSKLAVSLLIAKIIADNSKTTQIRTGILISLSTVILLPVAFILLQPDLGTVLVFTAFILVLYREGLSGNIILYGLLAIIVTVIALILNKSTTTMFGYNIKSNYILIFIILIIALLILFYINIFFYKRYRRKRILKLLYVTVVVILVIPSSTYLFNKLPDTNYQKQRIEITLGLREDPKGIGYNIHKSLSAIGSGETIGKGYKNATLANSKYKWVPEQSTDFIFCTYAEEWGFLGGFLLFILFIALIFRLILLAERQRSIFSRVYMYSVACVIFLHFTINVGMVMGIAPIIGIPLPFFSYGGSSLLAFSTMMFIAIKLDADRLDVLG